MYITYLGHACFKLQDKTGPEAVIVITDPFDKSIGLPVPHCEADIITISHAHSDHNNVGVIRGNPFIINTAGEYEIKGVIIDGIDSYHDSKNGVDRGKNVIFKIMIDDISLVHLGDLGHILGPKQLEQLEMTDILFIPVGGKYTLDAKMASEVIRQIEPRMIIPMHYKTKNTKLDIESVDKFIKEIGLEPRYEDKLKITKKELPQENTELVILNIN